MDPIDRDLMIRTVLGEAGSQGALGQAGVAAVIKNRLALGRWGKSPTDVVLAPSQFEPWQTRRKELLAIPRSSEDYIRAGRIVDAVMSGSPDPTEGATHFANVATVKERNGGTVGRNSWIDPSKQTAQIGAHSFYAPEGQVTPDKAAAVTAYAAKEPSMADSSPLQAILAAMMKNQGGASARPAASAGADPGYFRGGFGGYNDKAPLNGILGRFLANGFMGNGWHAGPVKTPQSWMDQMRPTAAGTATIDPSAASAAAAPAAASGEPMQLPGATMAQMPEDVPTPTPRPSDADLSAANPTSFAGAQEAPPATPDRSLFEATKPSGYEDDLRMSDLNNFDMGSLADTGLGGSGGLASLFGLV